MKAAIALCLLVSFAGSGCVAFYEPLSSAVTEPTRADARLASLHVLVRRPATLVSDHVVDTLSKSGMFASVAYLDAGAPDRSVMIEAFEAPSGMCEAPVLPVLTLGLIPASCKRNLGVYFHFVDRKLPDFACPWPQTEMVGWFGALFSRAFGDWTAEPNEAAFISKVRACIAAQSDAF